MIPFDLKLKKKIDNQWVTYNEQECVLNGEQKWDEYVQDLYDYYDEFTDAYLEIMYLTEDWAAPLKSLLTTKNVLIKEIENLKEEIRKDLSLLQSYSTNHGYDWREWNFEEVDKIAQRISDKTLTTGAYLNDFMVLVHNELLSSYFGHKRSIRKTLDPNFKVLTKKGIVQRMEKDRKEATKLMFNKLWKRIQTIWNSQHL